MSDKRVYGVVAACAIVAYLGALWNRFAGDDVQVILANPLVHSPSGTVRAFLSPYWPPALGGYLYRPLPIATYALDWLVDGTAWFHAVNLLWHATAAALVALLLGRWAGEAAALVGGVVFAVHPVHVEAVAQIVGRAELMAAVFTGLAVYAALERGSVARSSVCWVFGLLSKENAVVAPALIVAAWALGFPRPPRRRRAYFAASWLALAGVYVVVRRFVVPDTWFGAIAPVFVGQRSVPVRLTAVAALTDVTRLLVFPLALRADYSPNERTLITTPFDWRFAAGLCCLVAWGLLLALAWRRGRKVEALGLAWVALAYAPVANLLFPIGVLIAERTLYLPSVGMALAVGALARNLRSRPLALLVGVIAVLGGLRTALRVPVWRDDFSVTVSMLDDSPRSYVGPLAMAGIYLRQGRAEKALEASQITASIIPLDPRPYLVGAYAALKLRRTALADSLLVETDRRCRLCQRFYAVEAADARQLGDSAVAEYLLAHARRLTGR